MAPQTWAPTTKSKVNVVFGAMTIGNGAEQSRTTDINEAAAILHGEVVWQARRKGEWAAVLRFPRAVNASLTPLPTR